MGQFYDFDNTLDFNKKQDFKKEIDPHYTSSNNRW